MLTKDFKITQLRLDDIVQFFFGDFRVKVRHPVPVPRHFAELVIGKVHWDDLVSSEKF